MRSDVVIVVSPKRQLAPCIVEGVEHLFVEQRIAQTAVEAFDERVLPRLSRIDVVPVDIVVVRPFQDRPACELRCVVADNAGRLSADTHKRVQLPCDACAGYARVSATRQGLSRQPLSFTAKMRNLRDAPNVSDRKSNDQRSPSLCASGIGVRNPRAGLQPRRRLTPGFSSV